VFHNDIPNSKIEDILQKMNNATLSATSHSHYINAFAGSTHSMVDKSCSKRYSLHKISGLPIMISCCRALVIATFNFLSIVVLLIFMTEVTEGSISRSGQMQKK
jgi:hypothetical protein